METAIHPEETGAAAPPPRPARPERLRSLDAFRGTIMLLMASSSLGIPEAAKHFPDSAAWRLLARQVEHAPWAGCTLWDLIQPAFMFMVGAALPWSIANRRARGEAFPQTLRHALGRSLALVLLAVFLTSNWSGSTQWIFTNVLAQIGLGYPFLFLLGFARPRSQWAAAAAILFFYWLAFALHPPPPPGFDWSGVGVPENWPHLTGFFAHWDKSSNFGTAFDRWFLNLFPREKPWLFSTGGYQTLNFIPSLATMIFGLLAGQWLRSDRPVTRKIRGLILAGAAGVILGQAIESYGICPIVKRIWTPAWAIYSAGIVSLMLAAFVAAIDGRGVRRWAFPLVVAGLNPLALYCMWQLMSSWVRGSLATHLGPGFFNAFGEAFAPMVERASVLAVFWLVLWWMHRRRIYLRL